MVRGGGVPRCRAKDPPRISPTGKVPARRYCKQSCPRCMQGVSSAGCYWRARDGLKAQDRLKARFTPTNDHSATNEVVLVPESYRSLSTLNLHRLTFFQNTDSS